MGKYKMYIIIGLIITAVVVWYFFGRNTTAAATATGSNTNTLDAADQAAYTQLLQMLQAGNLPTWFWNDVPLYFPGGARATFFPPDVAGRYSKTGMLFSATNELTASNDANWIKIAPQAYQLYTNYKAAAQIRALG